MYSVLRKLLRMSALRNTLLLAAVFLAIILIAGSILRFELTRQVFDAIDDDLALNAQRFESAATASGPGDSIFNNLITAHSGVSFGYLSALGENFGPVRSVVFETLGFQNLTRAELFHDRRFAPVDSDNFEDHDAYHEWEDDPDLWRVLVTDIGPDRLAVFTPIHEIEDALDLLPQIMWPITIATVMATLVVGVFLGLVQQRRINKVQSAFEQIAIGNLGHRIQPQSSRDDMDDLMHGFDTAATRLETSVQQMRDFSRNVAHELRTPLSELHLALDNIEDGPEQEKAIAKADKVMRTFDAILRISRLSAGTDQSHMSPIDLNAIAQQLYDLYTDSVEEAGQSLTLNLGNCRTVTGDRQLLLQLGSNLIENSIRYAGDGALVSIQTDGNRLTIADTGPGIPARDRVNVLQPLFTLDGSRSRQGNGLGLALVKAIADHHGAILELSEGKEGGLTVSVCLKESSLAPRNG